MKNKSAFTIRAVSLTMALFFTIGLSRPALGDELKYNFQQINVPGSEHTAAFGINDHGDIVGAYDTGDLPFGFRLTRSDLEPSTNNAALETTTQV